MFSRSWMFISFLFALVFLTAISARAQSTSSQPLPPEEQNESFRDTLKRMQIKREEEEHKKLLERALQIKEATEALVKEAQGSRLKQTAEKKLREIEKSARHIRSESGGSEDNQKRESQPADLTEALKQLNEAGERLHSSMEKTSRHVVSAAVVATATEIIHLVKIVRGFLN